MTSTEDLAAQVAELRARVVRTEDTLALYELKARYGELVDDRFTKGHVVDTERLDALSMQIAALFTPDGTWDGGPGLGTAVGRDAIAHQMRRTTLTFSRHLFVKPRIQVEGSRAWGRWDILCPCTTTDGTSRWMCGFEDDEYLRTDDGLWLHQSMRLTTVLFSPTDSGWDKIFH